MRPIILDGSTGAMLSRNEVTLARHSLEGETAELNRKLAKISRKAAEGRAKVFGDLSPTGEMLEPMGGMTRERLTRVYAAQASALEPFVDGFVCETFMSLAELKCAYNGVRRVSDKPVFATISVDGSGRTMCGDALLPALISMQAAGVDAFFEQAHLQDALGGNAKLLSDGFAARILAQGFAQRQVDVHFSNHAGIRNRMVENGGEKDGSACPVCLTSCHAAQSLFVAEALLHTHGW